MVTHDAQLASWADRVVFLRDGRMVDQRPRRPRACRPGVACCATVTGRRRIARSDTSDRRRAGSPRRRALGVAPVPARVAPADLLIVALLTVAVAAAIGLAPARPTTSPRRRARRVRRLPTTSSLQRARPDDAARQAGCSAAATGSDASTRSVIATVPVPGTVGTVDYRIQDPDGAFGGPMLDLRSGRYPVADERGRGHRLGRRHVSTRRRLDVRSRRRDRAPSSASSRTRATSTTSSRSLAPSAAGELRLGDDARRRQRGPSRRVPTTG